MPRGVEERRLIDLGDNERLWRRDRGTQVERGKFETGGKVNLRKTNTREHEMSLCVLI